MPSIWTILSVAFLSYMTYNVWHLYNLYMPKSCKEGGQHKCITSYLARNDVRLQLRIYTSTHNNVKTTSQLKELHIFDDLDPAQPFAQNVSVDIPLSTRRNGSLYAYAFVMPAGSQTVESAEWRVMASGPLTKYAVPEASTFKLLGNENSANKSSSSSSDGNKPVSHFCSVLPLSLMTENFAFDRQNMLLDLSPYLQLLNRNEYLPILIYNEMFSRVKDLVPLNTSSKVMELSVDLQLIGIGKLRLWSAMSASLEQLTELGFSKQDLDDVKGLFIGSNIYLLLLTMMVSVCHLLFDFLAFKNDISFWRQKDDIVGVSTKAVIWRCMSTTIVCLYLYDQKTSYLVFIPMTISAAIEYWKTLKALKINITWHGIEYGQLTRSEQATEDIEHEAMRKLYWVLGPLCAVGAVYSLLYTPHKGWYSWLLQSLVNGVYAFGFIFMLPQLYINYKLKSVAHLPWKAFMYKAFNTFIDDVFAFIITMPTSHRLACFRDDAVFIVYLIQRWMYPVDKQRVNEYGQTFDENKKTQ